MPPPVVHRPARGPLRLSRYIGYRVLHSGLPSRVRIQKVNRAGEYDGWAVARTHLSAVVRVIAEHYGACLVVLDYRRIGNCTVPARRPGRTPSPSASVSAAAADTPRAQSAVRSPVMGWSSSTRAPLNGRSTFAEVKRSKPFSTTFCIINSAGFVG